MYTKKSAPFRHEGGEHLAGQFIIKFRSGALQSLANVQPSAGVRGARALASALPETITGPMNLLESSLGAVSMKPLFTRAKPSLAAQGYGLGLTAAHKALVESVEAAPREALEGFQLVRIAKTATPAGDVRKRLTASPAVEFVEPVPNRWPAEADPQLNRQWGLRAIRWFNVARPDAAKVHVAVLDSGIDASHPDLKGTIETYYHAGNSARDYCGHGTHVAGTIAAIVNNGIGVAGVANCRLHCWKIFDDRKPNPLGGVGPFNFEYYVDALASLLDAKPPIKVVNLSIGGTASSNTEATLYRELRAAGILVVAAMGNEYLEGNPTSYPAAYDGVLAVGACDEVDRRGEFSNTGQHIQISAPGVNVLSTVPTAKSIFGKTTDYDSWDGTSMATPHVAGCAALVYAANGGALDAKAIEKLLTKRARKVPEMKGKVFTPEFGFGVVSLNGVLSNQGKGAKPKKPGKPKKKSKAKAKGD